MIPMSELNLAELVKPMLTAFQQEITADWPSIQHYAETEFNKIALSLITIEKLKHQHHITLDQAKIYLQLQKDAALSIFLTIQGLTRLMVARALTAALDSIKIIVNQAIGWVLL